MNLKVYLKNDSIIFINNSEEYLKGIPLFETSRDKLFNCNIIEFKGQHYTLCRVSPKDNLAIVEAIEFDYSGETKNFESNIICPYCNYENQDSCEEFDSSDEYECGNCGLIFSFEREVEVTYSSQPIKQEIKVLNI